MKALFCIPSVFLVFLLCVSRLTAQIEVRDGGKVGVIVTGQGNNLNVTQIFGKSPEYAELTKRLTRLDTLIQRKIVQCTKLQAANIADLYSECQKELGDLNEERDTVAKIEKKFKEDVQRLAETFSKINMNSERLQKAKALFDAGRIRDVQFMMNDKEMTAEGDALLKKKENIDTALINLCIAYRIKAQAKALDYADPLRIDSSIIWFKKALHYYYGPQTLYDFATFYEVNNFYEPAIATYQKFLLHPNAEAWQKGFAYSSLGDLYLILGDLEKALETYIKTNEIFTSLSKNSKNLEILKHLKNRLAISYQGLGNTYRRLGNFDKALGFYEEYNRIEKELYAENPKNVSFKARLSISYLKLGNIQSDSGNWNKALRFYEDYNRLEKELYTENPNDEDFKSNLASSYAKLGEAHGSLGNTNECLKFSEAYNRLAKELYDTFPSSVDFKDELAISYQHLGMAHHVLEDLDKALKFYEECNRLNKELYATYPNNVIFKSGLASSYALLGMFSKNNLKDRTKARAYFKQAELLWLDLVRDASKDIRFKEYLGSVQRSLKSLDTPPSVFELDTNGESIKQLSGLKKAIKDTPTDAAKVPPQYELVILYEKLLTTYKGNKQDTTDLSNEYGSLAWHQMFAKEFAEAEKSAKRGLTLDASQDWINANLAVALLYQGKWEAAKMLYLSLKDKPYGKETYKETFLSDLAELEKAGVTHTDVAKIRALLNN